MKAPASQTRMQTPEVHKQPLPPGLYIVATPIGNLGDLTLRALEVLRSAALIACEDTRITQRLLRRYGIGTPLRPYHDHNAARQRPALLRAASEKAVALVSDAGTPLISDPGYKLVRAAREQGVGVWPVPGASSVMAGLSAAGLPTDRFCFEGFLPAGDAQARAALKDLAHFPATLVFFESAKRLRATLSRMAEVLGAAREACVARELTKLHEEFRRGTLAELAAHYEKAPEPRGEIVLLVGPPLQPPPDEGAIDARLREALARLSLKDAVAEVCALLNQPKGKIYARALALKEQKQ